MGLAVGNGGFYVKTADADGGRGACGGHADADGGEGVRLPEFLTELSPVRETLTALEQGGERHGGGRGGEERSGVRGFRR